MNKIPKYIFIAMILIFLTMSTITVQYWLKIDRLEVSLNDSPNIGPKKFHLVMIAQELDNPYWKQIEQGAKVAAEKYNVTLEYIGPINADENEQIRMIEMAIASKIDGILTQGLQDQRFVDAVLYAGEKGIPTITVESDSIESNRIAYVGTDNYAAGQLIGKELIALTNGKAKVGIVTGLFNAINSNERIKGFLEFVKDYPEVVVVDIKESKIDKVGVAAAAFQILSSYPDIDVLIGTSALDGSGFIQMLKEHRDRTHLYIDFNKKIHIIAFDDLPETVHYIETGEIDATIVQKPYKMGYASVQLMVQHLNGERTVTMYNTDTNVIRSEAYQQKRGDHP